MYRLIIADDEENIRNGMAHSLPWREWGYEVVALCASGQEVLDQMESARPDVMLSDIRMPGMDGAELMQRLSRDYPPGQDRHFERLQRLQIPEYVHPQPCGRVSAQAHRHRRF